MKWIEFNQTKLSRWSCWKKKLTFIILKLPLNLSYALYFTEMCKQGSWVPLINWFYSWFLFSSFSYFNFYHVKDFAVQLLPFVLPPPPLPAPHLPSLQVLPSHPLSPLIRYSSPHLLLHSIPLLSTGICLGISRWKLYSISGAPYQHTIIMGNHAEQCWIQLGLPLWWHYRLQGPTSPGPWLLSTCIMPQPFTPFPSISPIPNHTVLLGYAWRNY